MTHRAKTSSRRRRGCLLLAAAAAVAAAAPGSARPLPPHGTGPDSAARIGGDTIDSAPPFTPACGRAYAALTADAAFASAVAKVHAQRPKALRSLEAACAGAAHRCVAPGNATVAHATCCRVDGRELVWGKQPDATLVEALRTASGAVTNGTLWGQNRVLSVEAGHRNERWRLSQATAAERSELMLAYPIFLPEVCGNDADLAQLVADAEGQCALDHPQALLCSVTLQVWPNF